MALARILLSRYFTLVEETNTAYIIRCVVCNAVFEVEKDLRTVYALVYRHIKSNHTALLEKVVEKVV